MRGKAEKEAEQVAQRQQPALQRLPVFEQDVDSQDKPKPPSPSQQPDAAQEGKQEGDLQEMQDPDKHTTPKVEEVEEMGGLPDSANAEHPAPMLEAMDGMAPPAGEDLPRPGPKSNPLPQKEEPINEEGEDRLAPASPKDPPHDEKAGDALAPDSSVAEKEEPMECEDHLLLDSIRDLPSHNQQPMEKEPEDALDHLGGKEQPMDEETENLPSPDSKSTKPDALEVSPFNPPVTSRIQQWTLRPNKRSKCNQRENQDHAAGVEISEDEKAPAVKRTLAQPPKAKQAAKRKTPASKVAPSPAKKADSSGRKPASQKAASKAGAKAKPQKGGVIELDSSPEKDADQPVVWGPLSRKGITDMCLACRWVQMVQEKAPAGTGEEHEREGVEGGAGRKRAKKGESVNGPSFARRTCPKGSPGKERWSFIRQTFHEWLLPILRHYGFTKIGDWEACAFMF